MNCPNCQSEITPADQFCIGCGEPNNQATAVATTVGEPKRVEVTLKYGGTDFPLADGETATIARLGGDMVPTIGIAENNANVSSKPITVERRKGKTMLTAGPNTRVVMHVAAGEQVELKAGYMIMAGDQLIMVE